MDPVTVSLAAALAAAAVACAARQHALPAAHGTAIRHARPAPTDRPPMVRAATYNIQGGKGTDGMRDIARTAGVLRGLDVVGLQEIHGPSWPRRRDQAAELGARLATGSLFMPARTRWFRAWRGNGLLSAFPVADWYVEPLVDTTGTRQRNLTTARIGTGGTELVVMITHLSRHADRPIQLRTVIERLLAHQRAVLLGDLNTPPEDPQLRWLIDGGHATDALATVLGDGDPPGRIDWILARGLTVHGGGMVPPGVSDHPLFWADLGWPAPGGANG